MRAEQRIGRLRFHPASVCEATHDGRPRRPVERAVLCRSRPISCISAKRVPIASPIKVRTVTKRNGAGIRSLGSSASCKRRRGSRNPDRRRLGEEVEPTETQRLTDIGWVEWGRELIWAVGFTSGGAPFGLRISDFEPADLEAMGLDFAALCDAGRLMTAESFMDEANDWLRDDDPS